MSKDFAFMFYPGDYLRDTQCLSEKVQVAYDRIMCEHMRNICITQQQLKFFTKRFSPDEISELMHTLRVVPGGFQIEWVAESIEKRKAYSDSRKNNRIGKSKNMAESYVPHMVDINEDNNKVKSINKKGVVEKKIEVQPLVTFTPEEIEKLKVKFGDLYEPACIDLSNFKFSKGTKYKSDYHTMLRWVADKFLNSKKENPQQDAYELQLQKIK